MDEQTFVAAFESLDRGLSPTEFNLPEAQRGTMNVYEVTPNDGKAGFVIASQFSSHWSRNPEGDETQILLD